MSGRTKRRALRWEAALYVVVMAVAAALDLSMASAVGGDIDELFKDEGFLRMSRSGESFGNNRPPPDGIVIPVAPPPPAPAPVPFGRESSGPRKRDKDDREQPAVAAAASGAPSPQPSADGKDGNSAVMPSVSFLDLAFGLDRSPLEKNIAAIFSKVAFGHTPTGQNTTGGKKEGEEGAAPPPKENVTSTATPSVPPLQPVPEERPTQVTYAVPPQQKKEPRPASTNNDTEYDFVPILQNPTVTRILAGSTGKRPLPTLLHLPDEIQRRLRENTTLFNEVNKDSMVDPKAAVAPPVPPQPVPETPPTPQPRPPPVITDEVVETRTESVAMPPANEIDAPRPDPAIILATLKPLYPMAPSSEHGPDRTSNIVGLAVAWDVHKYLMGTLFALLALYTLVSLVRLHGRTHILPKGYFLTLNSLMLILGTLRAVYLFYDAYNLEQGFPPIIAYLLLHIAFPCVTSAFAVLFLALLRATQVQLVSPRLQTSSTLSIFIVLHFAVTVGTDVVVGCLAQAHWLLLVSQLLSLCWALALAATYFVAFSSLYRAAVRQQGEVIRATFTKMHIEGAALPKRLPRPTLALAVRVAFALALLGVLLAGVQLYGLFGVYGVNGLAGMVGEPRPRPWPWWCFLLSERIIEVAMAALIAFLATRPIRCNDADLPSLDPHRGPPVGVGNPGHPQGQQRAAVFALFGCGHHLGCGPGLCRCAASQPEEGKTVAGDELYPTICSSNQAIRNYALSTGKTVYEDSFPLSTGPTVALGDKVVPLSSLAKRRPLKKSGTLLSTLSDGRATTPAACHQSSVQTGLRPSSSSMLVSDNGFVRFRTTVEPDELIHIATMRRSQHERSSDAGGASTIITSGTASIGRASLRSLPAESVKGTRITQNQYETRPRCPRGLYGIAGSLEYTDASSTDALSHYSQLKPVPAKYASTCSSESAANSFDVRLYPPGSGMADGVVVFRDSDEGHGTGRRTFRNRQSSGEPPPPPHRLVHKKHKHRWREDEGGEPRLTASPEYASPNDLGQFSDSDVVSSADSDSEDNADDEQESDPGSISCQQQVPHHIVSVPCTLAYSPAVLQSAPNSQDVTPDSAVVADISEGSSKNELHLGGGLVGGFVLPTGDLRLHLSSRDAVTGHPNKRSPGHAVTDILRISTSSLNDVINGCGVSAKGLLHKLKGSNFSLNGQHHGYTQLGSDELHRRAAMQSPESQLRPLLSPTGQVLPGCWDVRGSPLVSPGFCHHDDSRCPRACPRLPPHFNDLSVDTRTRLTNALNITPKRHYNVYVEGEDRHEYQQVVPVSEEESIV